MAIRALSSDSVSRTVGQIWDILVDVRDTNGELVDAVPVVTVTLPDDSTATPTVETVATGVYRAEYTPAVSGRYVASAAASGYGLVYFAAYVSATTAATSMPTAADYWGYVGTDEGPWTSDLIDEVIEAEASAQRQVCRVGAVYPPDLRQALLRRVQRNLVMRLQPAIQITDDGRPVITPTNDPEVRRLERPYRKLVMP